MAFLGRKFSADQSRLYELISISFLFIAKCAVFHGMDIPQFNSSPT